MNMQTSCMRLTECKIRIYQLKVKHCRRSRCFQNVWRLPKDEVNIVFGILGGEEDNTDSMTDCSCRDSSNKNENAPIIIQRKGGN